MEWSANYFNDWKLAKASKTSVLPSNSQGMQASNHKWSPPKEGTFILNTDAGIKLGEEAFSIGLVIRDCKGAFIYGKVLKLGMVSIVFEAEVAAIREGLFWLNSLPYQYVGVESDSLMAVQAMRGPM